MKGGIRPKIYIAEFHCPYSRLKGHSCEIYLSNYALDFELKMPKHFSSILSSFFSNERSRGLHCHSIKGIGCCCCRCFFCRRKQVLQSIKAPWQGFRNIQANQCKYSNRWGLGARRLATYTSHLHQSTN